MSLLFRLPPDKLSSILRTLSTNGKPVIAEDVSSTTYRNRLGGIDKALGRRSRNLSQNNYVGQKARQAGRKHHHLGHLVVQTAVERYWIFYKKLGRLNVRKEHIVMAEVEHRYPASTDPE